MQSVLGRSGGAPVGDSLDDRLEAAEQRVTSLLQQVDDNVMRAHDNASKLVGDVREFAGHAKAVQASVDIWVEFFRSFEECERKKFFAGQHEGDPSRNNSIMDVTADSLPSFFVSPRTPCLDDSMRAGLKRRYGSPGMVGDTPSFGASPPKSVKITHTALSDESGISCSRISPVGQPVFPRREKDDSGGFRLDDSMSPAFVAHNDSTNLSLAGGKAGGEGACNASSSSFMSTPKMSSPTRTIQMDDDFLPSTTQSSYATRMAEASYATRTADQSSFATRTVETSYTTRSVTVTEEASYTTHTAEATRTQEQTADTMPAPPARRQTPRRTTTPKKTTTPRRTTPRRKASARGRASEAEESADELCGLRGGGGEPVEAVEVVDPRLPELMLKSLPPVFREGEGAVQIRKVYGCFGCRGGALGDDYPTLGFEDVRKLCPEYEGDRTRFLLDALVAKRVLRAVVPEVGDAMWTFAGKEN